MTFSQLQLERSAEEAALKEKQRAEMEKKAAAAVEALQKAELAAVRITKFESSIVFPLWYLRGGDYRRQLQPRKARFVG